jgi:hypothetical protein
MKTNPMGVIILSSGAKLFFHDAKTDFVRTVAELIADQSKGFDDPDSEFISIAGTLISIPDIAAVCFLETLQYHPEPDPNRAQNRDR